MEGWNFNCHKTCPFKPKPMLQVDRVTYIVIDTSFRVHGKFNAKITQRYFCGMHGMS